MRRAFAALLVLAFSLPLIAPAFASVSVDSQLPACCRRGGKHHCAMTMEGNLTTRYHVVNETCPFAPLAHLPCLQPHALALLNRPASSGFAASQVTAVRSAEAGYRISLDRNRHKRGPPAVAS